VSLAAFLAGGGVAVLSGAGLSTESGIPDYRGAEGSLRRNTPMTYQEFTGDAHGRQRYWARSVVGWQRIRAARPNDGHRAVAAFQASGLLSGIVTQNVDGLHQAGGAQDVIELHGGLDRVACLGCGGRTARAALDERLRAANPGWVERATRLLDGAANADGDAELPDQAVADFVVVPCEACGGVLKPDVVFFGEAVDPSLVAQSYALIGRSRVLLVLGSSLTVMSGRRFVLRAAELGLPVAIVNRGETRGDPYATLRIDAPLGATLTQAVMSIGSSIGSSIVSSGGLAAAPDVSGGDRAGPQGVPREILDR
jgi:NAD-dependent SIR2 family protein deacetylase